MRRRNLILLLGGASSGAMSVGTGAFSSMEAERGVEVNVVEDDEAFVGYETPEENENGNVPVSDGDRLTLVTVRNRFSSNHAIGLVGFEIDDDGKDIIEDVSVDVEPPDKSEKDPSSIEDLGKEYDIQSTEKTFKPPGKAQITANIDGISSGQTVDIEVTVTVKGTGVAARLFGNTRMFTIEGTGPARIDALTFNGARNANADGASGTYTLDFWLVDKNDSDDYITQEREWNGTGNVNSGNGQGNSEINNYRLLAVRFRETNQAFYRPNCGINETDLPWNVETVVEADGNGNSACNPN